MLQPNEIKAIAIEVVAMLAPILRQDDEWITAQRASEILGCHNRTLRAYVKSGLLTDNKPPKGGIALYKLDSVQACRFKKSNSKKQIK